MRKILTFDFFVDDLCKFAKTSLRLHFAADSTLKIGDDIDIVKTAKKEARKRKWHLWFVSNSQLISIIFRNYYFWKTLLSSLVFFFFKYETVSEALSLELGGLTVFTQMKSGYWMNGVYMCFTTN